nr:MAG TPA: hypothetical protein [Caudoviricetes sp.]
MDFHQRHLRLRPTSIELDIRDFHSYFIILFLKRIFSNSRHGSSR